MATRQFDRLNTIKKTSYSDKMKRLEDYFGEMDLPEDEIKDRVYLADDLDTFFKRLFVLLAAAMAAEQEINKQYYYDYAANGYADTLTDYGREDLAEGYRPNINATTQSIVDTTLNHPDSAYYVSDERAIFLAMNESNAVLNYDRDVKAIEAGYTSKVWITKFDAKVRETHKKLHNKKIGIYDTFLVGVYDMRFPLDITLGAGPEEVCNCRCVCKYGNLDEKYRLKDEESVFRQSEGSKEVKDHIKPHNVIKEINKSEIGQQCLQYLEEHYIPVKLNYKKHNNNIYGRFYLNEIDVYVDKCKTIEEVALTVIHEATHAMLKGVDPLQQEFECFANEKRHLGIELTEKVKNDIMEMVYEIYGY